MQAALDCFPCLLRQALQAARFAGAGGACQRRIVNLALEQLREAPDDGSPLAVASAIYEMVCRETGQPDPYRKAKEDCTHEALRWLPELRERLETAADPFGMALKAAVAGNVMDYGAFARFDVSKLLERLHEREFTICDRQELEARLGNARSLTYFADNAGEIVFDRLLIESLMEHFTLDHVHLVVRSEPFLNDVCRTEAEESGVTGLPGVEIRPGGEITYTHLLFDRHRIVMSNGWPVQVFWTTSVLSGSAVFPGVVAPSQAPAGSCPQVRATGPGRGA